MKNIYKDMYETRQKLDLIENCRVKIMLEMINELHLTGKNILDIGCFDGTLLSLVTNRNNKFYGIDANDFAVRQARKKGIKVKQFFFDDVTKIPFADKFFHLIAAGEIIEHIYDTDFFLRELKRILKPGGYLLISTPNIASLGRRLLLLTGISPIIEISPNEIDSPGHIRYFTFKTLAGLLAKHGLKVLQTRSDVLNLSNDGRIRSIQIPKIFPSIGQSIICLCQKKS